MHLFSQYDDHERNYKPVSDMFFTHFELDYLTSYNILHVVIILKRSMEIGYLLIGSVSTTNNQNVAMFANECIPLKLKTQKMSMSVEGSIKY